MTPIYELGEKVAIECSGETGEIIGVCYFSKSETSYLLRYATKDGEGVEKWWEESALKPNK